MKRDGACDEFDYASRCCKGEDFIGSDSEIALSGGLLGL